MHPWPNSPVVYEVNTWVWLYELSRETGRRITLSNVPQTELEGLADYGYDALWLAGVWERSDGARALDRQRSNLRARFREVLPNYTPEDVIGSPYAISNYQVDAEFGGDEELATFRERLEKLDLRLILDFVPNHFAFDHSWTREQPQRLVRGDQNALARESHNYFDAGGGAIFAYGRDPGVAGWPDTVQLDYRLEETRQAMAEILLTVAEKCDGVRCDMAMLVMHDVFLRTWGGHFDRPGTEFWPSAIELVKNRYPNFLMLAEVYWDLEYQLQQQGFDYTYDKRLYDKLLAYDATSIRAHLRSESTYQRRLARFVENHDEERALTAFGPERSRAAAAVALTLAGMRIIHDGQLEGRRVKLPVHLRRRPQELLEPGLEPFYRKLLEALRHPVFHNGHWQLLEPREAWHGNASHLNFVAYMWALEEEYRLLVVNLSNEQSQCYLRQNTPAFAGVTWELNDLLSIKKYIREGNELLSSGLYLDMPLHGYHLFDIRKLDKVPVGLNLRRILPGHDAGIYGMAWSPDGRFLASASEDKTIRIWNVEDGAMTRQLEGHEGFVECVSWSPEGNALASGSQDNTVRLWEIKSDTFTKILGRHEDNVLSVAWSSDKHLLASGSIDRSTKVWDLKDSKLLRVYDGQNDAVNCVSWSPDGKILASGSADKTVQLRVAYSHELLQVMNEHGWISSIAWTPNGQFLAVGTGNGTVGIWNTLPPYHQAAVLEAHTERVLCVAFSADGRLLASKSADDMVRLWECESWKEMACLKGERGVYLSGLAFHPKESVLATRDDSENVINIWDIDLETLLRKSATSPTVYYTNAKVVLVGDTGTGKTCLARALLGEPYINTDSTNARKIWPFSSERVRPSDGGEILRELFLWDLAGQPDYRVIHQLHLPEAAIALVLFDSRSATDPFAAVRYWVRALGQAQRARGAAFPMKKFLVEARTDVGRVGINRTSIDALLRELHFDGYFETSAKTGRGISELAESIRQAVAWESMPVVSSTELLQDIKTFLLEEKKAGHLLTTNNGLYRAYLKSGTASAPSEELRAQFDACIRLLESRGLIRRLSFGSFVLLQPEVRDVYASAMVNAARDEPDGYGWISEDAARAGDFEIPQGERISDRDQEKLLLLSTIEDLLRHELALRDQEDNGSYLIFPSQLTRENPNLPEPDGKSIIYCFDGPVFNIYATLIVRLSRSGFFVRKELWKNAATFSSQKDGTCGIFLREMDEGRAELMLFFDPVVSEDTRFQFDDFIHTHLLRRAAPESVHRRNLFICPECKTPIANSAVKLRLERGLDWIACNVCDKGPRISLVDREEIVASPTSQASTMGRNADIVGSQDVAHIIVDAKRAIGEFDVFLCHNHDDAPVLLEIADALESMKLLPWLAEREVRPGDDFLVTLQSQIKNIKSAALCFGPAALGKWHMHEILAFTHEFVERKCQIIPVILRNCETTPELPPFLKGMTMVDFREPASDPIGKLYWGITGERWPQ